jgi:hypothetical protein
VPLKEVMRISKIVQATILMHEELTSGLHVPLFSLEV